MNTNIEKNKDEFKFTKDQQLEINRARKFGPDNEYVRLSDISRCPFLDMVFERLPSYRDTVKEFLRELEASVENHLRHMKQETINGRVISNGVIYDFLDTISPVSDFEDMDWMVEAAKHPVISPYINLIAGVLGRLQVTNDYLNDANVPESILAYAGVRDIIYDVFEHIYLNCDKDVQLNIRTGELTEVDYE